MTIADQVRLVQQQIESVAGESALLEAQLLVAHFWGQSRSWLIAHSTDSAGQDDALTSLVERRKTGEPLAYILGRREFFTRNFVVTPATLIPRQETEALVEAVLASAPANARILDIGSGSGCIAITIALERPDLEVTSIDVSADALAVAKQNANLLGATVEWVESDLLQSLEGETFDVIVSNPPYVETHAKLAPSVRLYEPSLALFAGEDGMDFYRRIARDCKAATRDHLWLEIGDRQEPLVRAIFQQEGWTYQAQRTDLLGWPRALRFCPLPPS